MSVAPSLRAAARAAYRDLLKASASTFAGDEPIQKAFRLKMRTETLALDSTARNDAGQVEEKIQLAKELAATLRRNVVQARRVEAHSGEPSWSLRFTKDTEIGDNSTIKDFPPVQSNRRARRMEKSGTTLTDHAVPPETAIPRNFSMLKKAHKQRKVPELREEDLEESFVRGSGPGGQSINKTENNVQLLHKPTGLRVACQETRSLATNRMLARRHLLEKLDKVYNPGLSKGDLQRAKQNERERQRRKKAKKKAKKQAEQEAEDGI
ncbi:RF-1 domain-containing protein [Melanogaster broomeanus]|nr:RF-1 domain-containing protein [Melanogaster broomeanus]